jgi:hypothetical protein
MSGEKKTAHSSFDFFEALSTRFSFEISTTRASFTHDTFSTRRAFF